MSPRLRLAAALLVAAVAVTAVGAAQDTAAGDESGRLRLRLKPLPADTRRVWLETDAAGHESFVLLKTDGATERLEPAALAARLAAENRHRTWLYRLLNITSTSGVLWVVLGLTGQVLFTGRMVLQWLVSEKHRRSVVPVGFWWMSLGGATMLLVYFVWRRDIVGVLGQSTGWFIYVRNLVLIYHREAAGKPAAG